MTPLFRLPPAACRLPPRRRRRLSPSPVAGRSFNSIVCRHHGQATHLPWLVGKAGKLLQALTRGLEEVAQVEPWTTSFNPGTTTLERLLELTREVDFAAFVFAQDDWTSNRATRIRILGHRGRRLRATTLSSKPDCSAESSACAGRSSSTRRAQSCRVTSSVSRACVMGTQPPPRDQGHQPEDPNGDRERRPPEPHRRPVVAVVADRADCGEPSAVSLLRISRDRDGALEVRGRSWQEDGRLSARYWSEATREKRDPAGVFYYRKGERPLNVNAPQLNGTGEIVIESADRAAGYFTTRSDGDPNVNFRTSGIYLRADPNDLAVMDGRDDRQRVELIAERLKIGSRLR
jgi:hypothetical protein